MNEQDSNQSGVTPQVEPNPVQPTAEAPLQPASAPAAPVEPAPAPAPQAEPVQPAVQPTVTPAQPAAPVQQPTQDPTPVQAVPVEAVVQPVEQVVQPVEQAVPQDAPAQATAIDGTVVEENSLNSGINSLNAMAPQDVSNVGFVASGEIIKKKANKGVVITIVVLAVVLLGLLGYFVIFPWVVKTYFSDPKKVYETAINEVAKNLNSTVDDLLKDKMIYDANVTIETNIAQITQFSSYKYGLNVGVDPNKKLVQYGLYVVNPAGNEKSYYNYLRDGTSYQKYSNHENLIYNGKANMDSKDDLVSFQDILSTYNRANAEDTKYLINKISSLLIGSIDESKLYKEDASINVNGNNLKVLANKYVMDQDNQKRTKQFIVSGLLDDEKSLDIISTMQGVQKADVRTALENMKKEDNLNTQEEEVTTYEFIIYTYGTKNTFVGLAVQTKKDGNLHYYVKDNYEELVINYVYNDIEQDKEINKTIKVIGNKNGGVTKYEGYLDDKKLGEVVVRAFDKTKIDLDYSYIDEVNGTYTGSVKYNDDRNSNRSKATLEFTMNVNSDKLSVVVNLNQDWTSEVANINTKAAETLDESAKNEISNKLMESLLETPIGEFFKTESGEFDPSILSFYSKKGIDDPNASEELFQKACMNLVDGNYTSDDINCVDYVCTYMKNGSFVTESCY